jgi:hypothetical protein
MERWPKTIWIGAGVLVAVAAQMIWAEPLLQEFIKETQNDTVG